MFKIVFISKRVRIPNVILGMHWIIVAENVALLDYSNLAMWPLRRTFIYWVAQKRLSVYLLYFMHFFSIWNDTGRWNTSSRKENV